MSQEAVAALSGDVERILRIADEPSIVVLAALERILSHFGCQVGTVHRLDRETGMLNLVAQCGIPDALRAKVGVIPIGKGMGGLAAQRREPVQLCNLQTDASGVAEPGARQTQAEGSIAVPCLTGDLHGVLGVAKSTPYQYTESETDTLMAMGRLLAEYFARQIV